ncbi:hypothetical protein HO173_000327 [Letharia columbiana]|uniref:Small ribosomal subunit protein uS9m n=1 Tax=Letharia columbiana TaxID=112416 RepID=A0A8H6LA93_9LECA|nr:uncharacterized protein HO173_000327 [Letharia columbiana]KAF6241616.1 hypothetical protein HO173_000327 [Letharia columbiana]
MIAFQWFEPWLPSYPGLYHHGGLSNARNVTVKSCGNEHSPLPALLEPLLHPPVNLTQNSPSNPQNARVVPASPSYFTGRPDSTDNYLNLLALLRRYQTLPTVAPAQAPRVAWRTVTQYRLLVGEPIRASKYHKVVEVLQRLNRIHPAVMPAPLKEAMEIYKRDIDPYAVTKRPNIIDADGRAYGVGRRKSSSAKVYLVQGEGEVLVNGKSINSAFGRIHDRESALWALKATGRMDKYNVWALVSGGGSTGQAEAITLGAAKALMVFEPALKPALRRAGCVTRDPRRVERKKPGHVKARKMPAWVKR